MSKRWPNLSEKRTGVKIWCTLRGPWVTVTAFLIVLSLRYKLSNEGRKRFRQIFGPQAMFCSTHCRVSAWEAFHRVECRLVPALNEHEMGPSTRMPLRTFLIACHKSHGLNGLYHLVKTLENETDGEGIKGFDQNGQYSSSDYRQIHHLFRNKREIVAEQMMDAIPVTLILNGLETYSDFFSSQSPREGTEVNQTELMRFASGLLLKYVEIITTNTFSVSEYVINVPMRKSKNAVFGHALYSTLSLLDHSCNPNAVSNYHDGYVHVVQARRLIRKGEGIFITYGKHFAWNEISERSKLFRIKFCFECKCEACVNNWPTFSRLQPEDNPVFICQDCRLPLPKTGGRVLCSKCGKQYNRVQMAAHTMQMRLRLKHIMDQIEQGSLIDFTLDIANFVKIIDSIIQSPSQLVIICVDHLISSFSTRGNLIIEH